MEHRPIKKTTRGISLGDSRLGLPEGIIRYAFLLIFQSLKLNATINSNNSNSPKLFPDFFFFLASLDLGFTLGRAHSFVADSCSGQLNPDTQLSRFSASAGGIPSLC
ncbi:hypothetical protein, partial [Aeromonas sp. QDB54]|uniref:hypothetical protein n=1 Tax=Aeromonas sp. QDB54 TaxID=2989826 RepID=UPI0022DFCF67